MIMAFQVRLCSLGSSKVIRLPGPRGPLPVYLHTAADVQPDRQTDRQSMTHSRTKDSHSIRAE